MFPQLPLGLFGNLFEGPDLIVIAVLGILLFGRRLPEIGRNVGRTIVEFKKGLKQTGEEVSDAAKEPEPDAGTNSYRQIAPNKPAPRQIKQIATSANVSDEP